MIQFYEVPHFLEFPHEGFIPTCLFSFSSCTAKKLLGLGLSSASIANLRGMGEWWTKIDSGQKSIFIY